MRSTLSSQLGQEIFSLRETVGGAEMCVDIEYEEEGGEHNDDNDDNDVFSHQLGHTRARTSHLSK